MAQQLPDEPFTERGLASAWFLFRQPWMLWPAIVVGVGFSGALIATSIANGHATAGGVVMMIALAPVLGFGFAALTALPGFMLLRALRPAPAAWQPEPPDRLIERVKANHFLGAEGRGGRLAISERALVFEPHRFNVQLAPCRVDISRVRSVGWRRIVGRGGPISSTLELDAQDGYEVFVVPRADELAALIEARIASARERESFGQRPDR